MNEGYALRYLPNAMGWNFEEENKETTWLRMMSDFKYDSYRDFWAGSRFAEALLNWLQQFKPEDRRIAYDILRKRLIFISFTEMQHLVNRTLPVYARGVIAERVVKKFGIPKYMLWATSAAKATFDQTLKRTLFIGLSDGARIDGFRRANVGLIENDQVALGYELSEEKWKDLHDNLKERTKDADATFEVLFLIDDFFGSGKTLIRKDDDQNWKGKLIKLAKSYCENFQMFSPDCNIAIHHYIGTEKAQVTISQLLTEMHEEFGPKQWFCEKPSVSLDLLIRNETAISVGQLPDIDHLVDEYYDPAIETKSIKVGGTPAKYGFAKCGLPLILEHNTPNNSLALLWAESPPSTSSPTHSMRPLFRRRQRHS